MTSTTTRSCGDSGWAGQFGNPSGWRGALVGRLMALKNAGIGRLAVDTLAVRPGERILEIGFGHGKAIAELARRNPDGLVAGVDRSAVMVRQAGRRNRRHVASGRVELARGDVERLPYPDDSFDKVFEVNTFHHWSDPLAGLREARRVLATGGTLLLCLRMKHPTRSRLVAPGYTAAEAERVVDLVRRAGFRDVRTIGGSVGRREVRCLVASK